MRQEFLDNIIKLVGAITPQQLRYVDSFITEQLGLLMPAGGACLYALTAKHSHPSYMFVLSFDEQTQMQIGDKRIISHQGKIVAVSPDITHHELPADLPPRYIAIFIAEDFFEKQLCQYQLKRKIEFRGDSFNTAPHLLPLLKNFMLEVENKKQGASTVLYALSLEICHCLIRSIFDTALEHDSVSTRMEIDRTIEYLHSNLDKKITTAEMAATANMSHSHFFRIFKKEIGRSPLEYLSEIRLKRVKKLIMAGDQSLTEIALECGFNSSAYLSASFYKKYKITPSAYRKNLKK